MERKDRLPDVIAKLPSTIYVLGDGSVIIGLDVSRMPPRLPLDERPDKTSFAYWLKLVLDEPLEVRVRRLEERCQALEAALRLRDPKRTGI